MDNLPAFLEMISQAIVEHILRLNERAYEWYRNHTAPYYVLPPRKVEEAQPKEIDQSREDV